MKRTFYKVKPEYDDNPYWIKYYGKKLLQYLCSNELITPYVFNRSNIPDYKVEKVRLETSQTYWFFGKRFEDYREQ